MKILVPVKRVVDPYAKVKPLADGSGLDLGSVKFDINPFDEIAVEEAVQMKEQDENVHITVVTIGTADSEEQLRKALAMGADQAILVETSDQLDPSVVACELEVLAKELEPDVILMGKQATDYDNNQVGQMLAARLGWPQATFAAKIVRDNNAINVTRETDTGEEILYMPLPCLITTDLRLNEPRYIALPGIIKARSKPLEKRSRATSVEAKSRITKMVAPPQRSAGVKVGSVDELLAGLNSKGVL